MRPMIISFISAFATIGIVACAQGGDASSEPMEQVATENTSDAGPAVGAPIPEGFVARDTSGAERHLADITGENGIVLVFNRSVDWCSYCQAQMVGLRDIESDLAERGYTLATLSYDSPQTLAGFARRENIGYLMLSDEGSAMIDAFELRDPQYGADSFAYGVPRPAIFVIGSNGEVQAKMVESDYRVRPENSDILAVIDAL